MKGVYITKAKVAHEDERRTILEIMNGQFAIKNLKVLKVKKGEKVLGNHWHTYPEVMYVLKGSALFTMEHKITGEIKNYILKEGDVMFRDALVIHSGTFKDDSIIIEGAAETYVSPEFNDIPEKIL